MALDRDSLLDLIHGWVWWLRERHRLAVKDLYDWYLEHRGLVEDLEHQLEHLRGVSIQLAHRASILEKERDAAQEAAGLFNARLAELDEELRSLWEALGGTGAPDRARMKDFVQKMHGRIREEQNARMGWQTRAEKAEADIAQLNRLGMEDKKVLSRLKEENAKLAANITLLNSEAAMVDAVRSSIDEARPAVRQARMVLGEAFKAVERAELLVGGA